MPNEIRVRVPSGEPLSMHTIDVIQKENGVEYDITEVRYADDDHDEYILTERVQ